MKRQKTFYVNNKKIKIVSTLGNDCMPFVRTNINGSKYFVNFEIMADFKITGDNHREVYEEFVKRAMDRAYLSWVKEFAA